MKAEDAKRIFRISPEVEMNELVEAQALDAFRCLWDRTVDNATADPESRRVTPSAVKAAIEDRLREAMPKGSLLPDVSVKVNAERTGFSVEITPAKIEPFVLRQVR